MRLQQITKILLKQNSLHNITYLRLLLSLELIIKSLLLHAISNFKDLASKKKKLNVIKFYVFRLKTDLLV